MKIVKNVSFMMSVGVAVMLLGCGGGNDSGDKSPEVEEQQEQEQNNNTPSDDSTDSLVAGNGVLIETTNSKKLAWVNTTTDNVCKISRSTKRTGTVYQDGVAHCQGLSSQNYVSINSWRLPTVREAKSLMKLENKSLLLFPSSNPNCAIMTTNTENTFVYTTSDWNVEADKPIGGDFVDMPRNNATAGIRCVADQ